MSEGEGETPPVVSLASLMARVDEVGECLLWRGYALDGLHPQWRVGGRSGRLWNVRRLLWLLVHGPLDPGLQVGVRCGSALCVHPDCLVARTRSQACSGRPKAADHRARIALAKRQRAALTADVVRAIRLSQAPCVELDQQHGLSRGYASKIRTGVKWKVYGSPFSGPLPGGVS